MVAAPVDRPVSEVLKLAADSAYTRIPIYEGDIDHIVGFVHLRDLFALYRTDVDADIRSIVRPVPFVPETLTSAEVWERLDEAQSYLAIVFDEYGGTSGLITREDLVEELFGELQDEFDQEQALHRTRRCWARQRARRHAHLQSQRQVGDQPAARRVPHRRRAGHG